MGKTVTTEFAYFEPGPTRNPHNLNHTPGGSSSGSAAGVASGFFPFALGSQTGGSVIRPAAYCGVVGFKPSFGRISLKGVMPLSDTLDHLGIFCEDPSGIDLFMHVLAPDWSSDASPKGIRSPVLGVPDGPYLNLAAPQCLQYFEMTLERVQRKGFQIKRINTLSNIHIINDNHLRLMKAEIAKSHASWYEDYGHLYGAKMTEAVDQGCMVGDAELEKLRAETTKFRMKVEEQMKSEAIDAWICPPTQDTAPEGLSSTGSPIMNFSWTHGGLPCLSLPSGKDEAGLPHGVQIVGYFMKDEALIASIHDLFDILDEG
jgi:Asp-tRNA(Asn)/Glu-tRNA(Gln) amidotransferase A subunit family amidase